MKWILEQRNICEVYPNVKNPRRLGKRQAQELKKSLERFGLCQPIVLSQSGIIIGGHQRVHLLRSLGYDTVDVYVPETALTQEEEEELAIRLNKNLGEWDIDVLANHWEPEKLCEWGFSMEELQLESIPGQTEEPKRFSITISCTDQDQLEMIESHVQSIVNDFSGAKYKVKVK